MNLVDLSQQMKRLTIILDSFLTSSVSKLMTVLSSPTQAGVVMIDLRFNAD